MRIIAILLSVWVAVYAAQNEPYEESWFNTMSLKAYKTNYFIPLSYYTKRPTSYVDGTQFKHAEVEVQFSIKYNFAKNLIGQGGKYYIAYTHHSFWQLYAKSKPFRENIYNPELFARYELSGLDAIYLTHLQLGYEHQSNGQFDTTGVTINNQTIGNLSRGLDTIYVLFRFGDEQLHADLKFWTPVTPLDDNPDLMDYMGYSSLKVQYEYERQLFAATVQGNLSAHKGSIELCYGYPIGKSVDLFIKGFSGYVDTLVDYNKPVNKIGIGFSFSR